MPDTGTAQPASSKVFVLGATAQHNKCDTAALRRRPSTPTDAHDAHSAGDFTVPRKKLCGFYIARV